VSGPVPLGRSGGPSRSIGVDVGGTKLLGVVLDEQGRLVAERRTPTPRGAPALVDSIVEVVSALDAEVAGAGPLPVGIGAPGLVTRDGRVLFAPNLPGVSEMPLVRRLNERLGRRPVVADNDATCAGWGEVAYGAAQGARHAVVVTLGTGIGAGIISDGRLFRGANGFAGEIGHMVVDPSGPPCPCGRVGCWERFASGSGLGRLGREAALAGQSERLLELAEGDAEAVRGEHVTAAAREGDAGAVAVMSRFAWWLAAGLANLADAFDPEVIVIGGGLVEAGEVLLGPTRQQFLQQVEGQALRPDIPILPARLGERAGAIGAAALAAVARHGGTR
jgi:glucokinase